MIITSNTNLGMSNIMTTKDLSNKVQTDESESFKSFMDISTKTSETGETIKTKASVKEEKTLESKKPEDSEENLKKTTENKNVEKESGKDTSKTDEAVDSNEDKTDALKTEETKEIKDKEPEKEDVDALKESINKIKDALSKALEIDDEKLTEILEDLGLTQFALLNQENIASIVLKAGGEENTISLVTDESLYTAVNNVTEAVNKEISTVTKNLEIPVEEFKEAVKATETLKPGDRELKVNALEDGYLNFEEENSEALTENLNSQEIIFENVKILEAQPEEMTKIPTESLENLKNEAKENLTGNEENLKLQGKEEDFLDKVEITNSDSYEAKLKNFSVHTNESEDDLGGELTKEEDGFESEIKNESPESLKQPATFTQLLFDKTAQALNEAEGSLSYTSVDAENIMNQITESIKMDIQSELSEINLRLHPESLGNVHVRVTTNAEGVMTAQFTAQNESVKAVIESQAMVLKETLEAKGVTVEAVEVMVGTHEFERNLSDSERRNEEETPKRNRVRRIDLSEVSDDFTEDEAERIQKEIMTQNGNTIDYQA